MKMDSSIHIRFHTLFLFVRLMDLQTLDYMPIISSARKAVEEEIPGDSKQLPHFYGSELLKESLAQDTTAAAATMQKSVRMEDKRKNQVV